VEQVGVSGLAFWRVPAPSSGLPIRSAAEEAVGAAVAGAAMLFVFVVSVWGIGGIFPDGHFASAANIGVAGFNMNRWSIIYPAFPLFDHPPPGTSYYMHHPLGMFWTGGLFMKLFGAHDWVLRIPPLIFVTLTAFFLYRWGRAVWGPLEGALAAVGFVALPITLGFANYHDLEQPLMLGCVVASWGYARFRQSNRDVYALASIAGFAFAIIHDWEAYIWGASFLTFLFLRAFTIPEGWLGPIDGRRAGRYWALMCGTAVVFLTASIALIVVSDRLYDTVAMYGVRAAGAGIPLKVVLAARHVRIELMFTALAIALGKLAVPVMVARFVIRRDELELLPLFVLLMSICFYVWFKQGADVHIFWPHTFAAYFGLAVGALAASARDVWLWAAPRFPPRQARFLPRAEHAPWVALVVVGLPTLLVLRDGASLIRLARESGGRFIEAQLQSDVDRSTALRWFLERFPMPEEKVAFHNSAHPQWDTQWAARPHAVLTHQPVDGGKVPVGRPYLLDARSTPVPELRDAAARYHVIAVGWYWFMDRGAPPAPLDGFSFDEHDPSLFESLKLGATEPVRRIVPDPWLTWEWRSLLGQPGRPPTGQPRTLEQLRIAHNMALARGDAAAAARTRAELVRGLNMHVTAKWDGGFELLGVDHHTKGARSLTPYLIAGTPRPSLKVLVRAKVTSRRFLSTLPVDPAELDIAPPPPVPLELWHPGYIYAVPVVYRHRAGHETYTLGLATADRKIPSPARLGAPPFITLLSE
jgi:Dolichyl-phosphate-mannose-protein mannosyltransferase